MRRCTLALALFGLAAVLAACGGSAAGSPAVPTIAAARKFTLAGFQPAAAVAAKRPTQVSFTIDQPSGQPLTRYRTGPGPHTGVHLIAVRDDLSAIVHTHPPIGSDGRVSEALTFPAPGRWRILVDAYTQLATPFTNFQLFRDVVVSGAAKAEPVPPFRAVVRSGGVRVRMDGTPRVKALQPATLTLHVTTANGAPAAFMPWYGAIAHAIYFRQGSLSYYHTHVCKEGDAACQGFSGNVGSSPAPGTLKVVALLPQAGTWRLFLQCQVGGRIVTAPFTLDVS